MLNRCTEDMTLYIYVVSLDAFNCAISFFISMKWLNLLTFMLYSIKWADAQVQKKLVIHISCNKNSLVWLYNIHARYLSATYPSLIFAFFINVVCVYYAVIIIWNCLAVTPKGSVTDSYLTCSTLKSWNQFTYNLVIFLKLNMVSENW